MASPADVQDVIDELARDPLRHVVLLKHLHAYRDNVTVRRVSSANGAATLVALDTSVSPYDRQTYPKAAMAAFVASDHPELTVSLMSHVPRGGGIVFKLSSETDVAAIEQRFPLTRRRAFVSFTSAGGCAPPPGVHVTSEPSDTAFQLFSIQGYDRAWLDTLLRAGRAFACVAERDGDILSACFAFESFGPVWEIGGVVTPPAHRRQGLGTRVVGAALAQLGERGLVPRYQVEEHNLASIALARSLGLAPLMSITHYAHNC
jgi:GNAT superfamily N-acetyltransferase